MSISYTNENFISGLQRLTSTRSCFTPIDKPKSVPKKKGKGGIETAVANERKCLYGSHKDGQIHHVKTFF